jgi:hypothetical protein
MLRRLILATGLALALFAPALAANSQQDLMRDCNTQAAGMTGPSRQAFMSSCLSNKPAEPKKPNCVKGKPCGNSCIAKDKVCHKP